MRTKADTAQFSTVPMKAKVRQRPLVEETRLTEQKVKDKSWMPEGDCWEPNRRLILTLTIKKWR